MKRTETARRSRRLAFFIIAMSTCLSLIAAAQPRRPAARPAAPAAAGKKPTTKSDDADAGAGALPLEPRGSKRGESMPPESASAKDGGKGANVLDQKTLDGGQRVFRFGEVEVEGRLKTPQIVYFLRRVRAEFAAGDLGHRSFMRELGETKNEPSF